MKSFSKFCLAAINGNILRINPSGEMEEDMLSKDILLYTVGPMRDCDEYRAQVKEESHASGEDKKQILVDHLMQELEEMHNKAETQREILLKSLPQS